MGPTHIFSHMENESLEIPEQSQLNGTSYEATQSQSRYQNVALASVKHDSIFQVLVGHLLMRLLCSIRVTRWLGYPKDRQLFFGIREEFLLRLTCASRGELSPVSPLPRNSPVSIAEVPGLEGRTWDQPGAVEAAPKLNAWPGNSPAQMQFPQSPPKC